jgi:uncharacterized membrane protein
MNLTFAGFLVILTLILVKKAYLKVSKKRVMDERVETVGFKASRATFLIFTTTIAISSFILIFFGLYGTVPSTYIYYLGLIMSYLTCLILIIYTILFAYFNKNS